MGGRGAPLTVSATPTWHLQRRRPSVTKIAILAFCILTTILVLPIAAALDLRSQIRD